LTGTVSTTTTYAWNTSHGTTGTPGFRGSLMTSFVANSASLTLVLAHVGVYELNDIRTDWSLEHGWQRNGANGALAGFGVNVDNRTSGRGLL
jgi:hypothetical protein